MSNIFLGGIEMPTSGNLREIRMSQNKTILEISRLTLISPSDISQIELGKKPCFPAWRKRIAAALDMPEDEVFPEYQKKGGIA
jgi:transcriptional regulator with XRE-family HTH domain